MEVINLNLIPSGALPVVHASQYDEGRTFRANLMDGSTVYTLDGTEVLECDVKKPDGNIVTMAVTNTSDSYVEIDTTLQMCACAGESLAELHITKGAQEIGTLNFILAVERSPLENGIQSDSGIHNLQTQIADAVADQYAAEDVVFDATPTAGHGVGFAVTSEGVKNALDAVAATIPEELDDLSDVTYTGTPAMGEAVVWDGSKWTNGTVSTVGSIDDLNDVDTTGKAEGDSLRYDSGASEWIAKPIVIEVTQAEYDQLVLDGDLQPLTTYIITDAPNLNATSEDLSYDGGATSTHDVIASKIDISKFITQIYSGTSAQDTGDSISLDKSVSNFKLILIRFSSTANDMTYLLVHANEANTIFHSLSANGTDGQATYPLGFNTTMAFKLNGNKIDLIRLNYNQSGWRLKIVNVYGIIDVS